MAGIYQVHSLSEYFSIIEKEQLQHAISRGEAQKYPQILASAFRPFSRTGKYYTKEYRDAFYNCIGNSLTPMQQKHFSVYCQHSGLPTNLIDFTTSPLVSLFFAAYTDTPTQSGNGYVYFIRNNRLFPIDRYMENGYSGQLLENPGSFGDSCRCLVERWLQNYPEGERQLEYLYDEPAFLEEYTEMLCSFLRFIKEQQEDYTHTVMYGKLAAFCDRLEKKLHAFTSGNVSHDCFNRLHAELHQSLKEFMSILESGDIIEDLVRSDAILNRYDFQTELRDRYVPDLEDKLLDDFAESSLHPGEEPISPVDLLHILLVSCLEFSMYSTRGDYYLPFYATYTPPNISERVSMQNSIFICQTYHAALRDRNEPAPVQTLVTQQIRPDLTLEICGREKIRQQLDMVGINLKTIYGDHDNIAKYIRDML